MASEQHPARGPGTSVDVIYASDYGVNASRSDNLTQLNNALAACITNQAASVGRRDSFSRLILPNGDLQISGPWVIHNIFNTYIDGSGRTTLKPTGAFASMIDMDAVGRSALRNFRIDTGPTHQIDDGIKLEWSQSANYDPTNHVAFHDIEVTGSKFIRGIALGNDSGNAQVSECVIDHCRVKGAWMTGEATVCQEGFHVGSGSSANVVNFHVRSSWAESVRYPYFNEATTMHLQACGCKTAETACSLAGSRPSYIDGFHAEDVEHLATDVGQSAIVLHTYRNVRVKNLATSTSSNGRILNFNHVGNLVIKNMRITGSTPSPYIQPQNGASVLTTTATIDGLMIDRPLEDAFTYDTDHVVIVGSGFAELDSSDTVVDFVPMFCNP